MNFCHIAPNSLLDVAARFSGCYLTLAHLIDHNDLGFNYVSSYQKAINNAVDLYGFKPTRIMDNSGFEFYKEHGAGYVFDPDKLIECARTIGTDYIVLPDYPGKHSSQTIKAAKKYAPIFKKSGFGTFFVPQSNVGDHKMYLDSFEWAINEPTIDYIGVSILAAPIAYDAQQPFNRYLTRLQTMKDLNDRGLLHELRKKGKQLHFLGMTDGPREIELVAEFAPFIDTWDSSAACWAAVNGVTFDKSPTGLSDGKIERAVDFAWEPLDWTDYADVVSRAIYNMDYINKLISKVN